VLRAPRCASKLASKGALCDRQALGDRGTLLCEGSGGVSRLTYAELADASQRLAGVLSADGVDLGDRVAVLLPKSVELLIALVAIWRRGAVRCASRCSPRSGRTPSPNRIGPFEVETALTAHPRVAEAAVIGTPDQLRVEAVTAYVVPTPGTPGDRTLAAELQTFVVSRLAKHLYPRRVVFVDALPRRRPARCGARSCARTGPVASPAAMPRTRSRPERCPALEAGRGADRLKRLA
jgi:acyl-coenzyme A synthetase/AMP-(fatty) acid ligase